jgi:hypothetical protein
MKRPARSQRVALFALLVSGCLALGTHAGVIRSFDDQENIPNYTTGANLGTFTVGGTPDLYVGYTFAWNSGDIGNNKFVVLYFGSPSGGVNFGLKSNEGPGNEDFIVRYASSSPFEYAGRQVSIPTTLRVVGRIQDINGDGDYDAAALWIDPAAGDLNTPDASIDTFTMTIDQSPLGLRSVNLTGDDIDLLDIVVADDFASARAIPEPSMFALLVLACLFPRAIRFQS